MVFEWTLSKRLGLAYSKIDLSLLQRQSASQEKHGRLHIFQHQFTGYLRTRGQEALYETCAPTSEESLRTATYWIPEHQGTGDFMRSECVKLVLVPFNTHFQH